MAGEQLTDREWLLEKLDERGISEAMKFQLKVYLGVYRGGIAEIPIAEFRKRYPLKPQALNEQT
jgi:hypothetical protein